MNDTLLGLGLDRLTRLGLAWWAPGPDPADPQAPPDGCPVVLVGGMGTTAAGLSVLRAGLERAGHPVTVVTPGIGLGCAGEAVDEVVAVVRTTADGHGQPVGLVGHSRGGQFARVAARRDPDAVAAVVTLGTPATPTAVAPAALAAAGGLTALGTLGVPGLASSACLTGPCCRDVRRELATSWRDAPDDVPLTAVRARRDLVVPERDPHEPGVHARVVDGGHLGLLVSAEARDVVLDALARATVEPGCERPTRAG